jgi:hypothetical protein
MLIRYSDLRLHPLRGLHPDASPFEPVPVAHWQTSHLPADNHDRMGRYLCVQRGRPLLWWSRCGTILFGIRRGCLLPWLPVLDILLVHEERGRSENSNAVRWQSNQRCLFRLDCCRYHQGYGRF